MLNLSLKEKMKKILALASAAGITLVTTGCFSDYEKQNDDVAMQPVGYSSDVDSTTPKKEDSTSDFDPNTVTRLVIPEETALRVVITDKKDETTTTASDAIDEVTTTSKDEDYLYTSTTSVTLAKRENRPTATTATKATTKVTLKTTKATKPTTKATTTTTTTTVPVTEPPVVETEPPVVQQPSEWDTSQIGSDANVFVNYSDYIVKDLLKNYGHSDSIVSIDIGYGNTFMGRECQFLLQSLNYDKITDDFTIPFFFSSYTIDELENYKTFFYNFKSVQDMLKADIDYTKYTVDYEIGNFLNEADDAYRNGYFDNFMNERIVSGNVSQNVLSNPGAMGILYSYDNGKYLNFDEVDSMLSSNANYLYGLVQGSDYSK